MLYTKRPVLIIEVSPGFNCLQGLKVILPLGVFKA